MKNPIQQRIHVDAVKKVAHQFLGMENFSVVALIMVAIFFIGAGWLPDAFTNILLEDNQIKTGLIQLSGSLAIFIVFGCLIHHKIQHQQQVKIVSSSPPSARILIIFLSSCNKQLLEKLNNPDYHATTEDLTGTSWEMPALALNHHSERLEQLYVFTSSGENGTHHQFGHFHDIMAKNFPKLKIIELTGQGTDFERMAEVYQELDRLYEQLDARQVYGPDDIMLDITGGQKPNSIAGALSTLADGRRFQYVSTINKKVLCYDLVIEKA